MKKHAKNAPTQANTPANTPAHSATYNHTYESTEAYRLTGLIVTIITVTIGVAVTGYLVAMYHFEGYGLHPLAGLLIVVALFISGTVLAMGIATIHIDDYPTE